MVGQAPTPSPDASACIHQLHAQMLEMRRGSNSPPRQQQRSGLPHRRSRRQEDGIWAAWARMPSRCDFSGGRRFSMSRVSILCARELCSLRSVRAAALHARFRCCPLLLPAAQCVAPIRAHRHGLNVDLHEDDVAKLRQLCELREVRSQLLRRRRKCLRHMQGVGQSPQRACTARPHCNRGQMNSA